MRVGTRKINYMKGCDSCGGQAFFPKKTLLSMWQQILTLLLSLLSNHVPDTRSLFCKIEENNGIENDC